LKLVFLAGTNQQCLVLNKSKPVIYLPTYIQITGSDRSTKMIQQSSGHRQGEEVYIVTADTAYSTGKAKS